MAKIFKKSGATLVSAVIAVNMAAAAAIPYAVNAASERYEFEDAAITGDISVESSSDASGGSYLKMTESGVITATFNADATDIYNIIIYAGGIGGAKQQNLSINGVSQGALSIPESDGFDKIVVSSVKLNKGENTLAIEKSWGWTNFDYFEVEGATLPDIIATDTTCTDPNAIPAAQNLMNYMASVYGSHIISGQQEIYQYGPHGLEQEFEYLNNLTGHYPAIRGFDYGNFTCPAFGSDDGSTERVIDWVKNRGGIATSSWHLNVPTVMANYTIGDRIDWAQTTYTEKTDFSPSKAATPGTKENEYYMQALTTLAAEFKKLEAENIPIIWRPLHEAEGGGGETGSWFWWGREGSKAYKDLWIYTYKTLTEDFGCHNLIWEWNSYNFATSEDWYPGDEYVDIIGYDKYNCTDWSTGSAVLKHNDSAISSTFYGIMEKYNSAKMISMSENDSFSTVENLTSEKAGWLYFCTWYDGGSDNINFLSNPVFNTEKDTIDMYQSDYCITLDELPADLYTNGNIVTTKPTGTKPVTTTTTTATSGPTTEINADLAETAEGYRFTFDEAIGDKLYVVLEADKAVKFANGCVGISATVDGTEYWVSYQWKIAASDTVKVDLSSPFEVSYNNGEDKVTDKALIAEIAAEAQKQNTGLVQVWWVNDSAGEQLDNSNVVPVDVYIMKTVTGSDTTTKPVNTTVTTSESTKTTETTTVDNPSGGAGFHVDNQKIVDANGNEFIMRGVNIAHAWYSSYTEQSIKAIAERGCNTVRVVCADGGQWTKTSAKELENIISWCKENKLVCVLEVHDATGSDSIDDVVKAAEYWTEMTDILNANKDYVILNIANEWVGKWDSSVWAEGNKQAIGIVRDAGIENMIMIDAAGWGQYANSITEKGSEVFASDPDKNVVFSIHFYGTAGGSAQTIKNNIDGALSSGAPVIAGEFGHNHSDGDVDEEALMSYCEEKGLGYLAWSWKGNSGGVEYLDLVNDWEGTSLTEWGEIFFGAMKNSKPASVYTTSPVTTTTTSSTTTTTVTTVTKDTATTSETTSTTTVTGNIPVTVKAGDVNLDGGISVIDVIYLNKYLAKIINLNDAQLANAECVTDTVINSSDASTLLKYIVGKIASLPVNP
ncbi:MAG: glycosyl hydrolase [Ruminococcus sp.]